MRHDFWMHCMQWICNVALANTQLHINILRCNWMLYFLIFLKGLRGEDVFFWFFNRDMNNEIFRLIRRKMSDILLMKDKYFCDALNFLSYTKKRKFLFWNSFRVIFQKKKIIIILKLFNLLLHSAYQKKNECFPTDSGHQMRINRNHIKCTLLQLTFILLFVEVKYEKLSISFS